MRFCRRALAVILAFVTCAAPLLAQERALLYPGSAVSLNDKSLAAVSVVQSGDKVHTGDSEAQLTARGLLTLIEKDSTLHYGEELVVLDCGAMVVSSSQTSVQGSDTTVTPINGTAKFRMENRHDKLTVHVQSGSVRVSSDERTILTAGQSMERASRDGCPVVEDARNAPHQSATGSRKRIGALLFAGSGAAAAGIVLAGHENKPASPSRPD